MFFQRYKKEKAFIAKIMQQMLSNDYSFQKDLIQRKTSLY